MPETKVADPSTATKTEDTKVIEPDLEESDIDDEDEDSEEAPKGELHKSRRWRKVYGGLKEFKALGKDAKQLKTDLARLEEYDEMVAEAERKAKAKKDSDDDESEEDPELNKRRKRARKELSKIAPEVDAISRTTQRVDIFFDSLTRRADREMEKLLKDSGMSTGDKAKEAMSDVLAGMISEDKELYDDYLSDPKASVREAFKRFRADSVDAATRAAKANLQKDKAKLMGLPKTHRAGGSPEVAVNRTEGPRNLQEARKAAERRLAALEE